MKRVVLLAIFLSGVSFSAPSEAGFSYVPPASSKKACASGACGPSVSKPMITPAPVYKKPQAERLLQLDEPKGLTPLQSKVPESQDEEGITMSMSMSDRYEPSFNEPVVAEPIPQVQSAYETIRYEPRLDYMPYEEPIDIKWMSSKVEGDLRANPHASAHSWVAKKGENVRNVLELWSRQAQVDLIWQGHDSDIFIVRDSLSMQGSFESAVRAMLEQDLIGGDRPKAVLHVNPHTGQKTMVVKG